MKYVEKRLLENHFRTKIDNSIMLTCNDCSKFGKVQRETPPQTQRRGRAPTSRRRSYRSQEPTQEVVEDFHKLIREAREKKGWSREELGEKTYEKVSVINRLESGKMIPDLKLARKMEKVLKITLLEKTDQAQIDDLNAAQLRKATIGDIARIKKG